MRIIKATRRDWIWPGIFLALGLAAAAVGVRYYQQAFPEAAIDLKLDRAGVSQQAEAWLRLRGLDPERFRETVVFVTDEKSKNYLERELPPEEASRLMASDLGVWYWEVRRARPPDKEELLVRLSPTGDLVGFTHVIEEDAPGARLGEEEAQRIAEIFLRTQKSVSLGDYALVQRDLQTRSDRHDYSFTWERKGFQVKDATFRLLVIVQGDQVGAFREYLKIPEQWTREYTRMRSANSLLGKVASVFYAPLLIAAVVVLVQRGRKKQIAWKPVAGVAMIVGLAQAASIANDFSLIVARMPSNSSSAAAVSLAVIIAALFAILVTLSVGLTAAAGSPLYAEMMPSRLPLSRLFTFAGLRTREFFFATLAGYGLAAFQVGAVVVFYLVARRFGAWSPLGVGYSNGLGTPLPWVTPLATSLLFATFQEFSFRFFAIPLLYRWLKSRWLAILIPALIWGFMQSGSPQQPPWIRGVEVGAMSILFGWVMLRFGILATLVANYTYNAALIGLFLIRSEQLSLRLSGVLVADAVLIPLVVCAVLYFQHGGFVEEDAPAEAKASSRPAAAVVGAPPATGERIATYSPMLWPRLRTGVVLALVGVCLFVMVKPPSFVGHVRFTVDRHAAEAEARAALVARGVDVSNFRTTSRVVTSEPPALEYLRREVGLHETISILKSSRVRLVEWETRFFRPLSKEEYRVRVAPGGGDARVTYILGEDLPGARLTPTEAGARAQAFLAARGVRVEDFTCVEAKVDERVARYDHTLTWEARAPLVSEARERVRVQMIGEVISGPEYSIKVPDAWERRFTAVDTGAILISFLLIGLACVTLVLFVKRLGQGPARTHVYVRLALAAGLALSLSHVLDWPRWVAGYDTAVPWINAVAQHVVAILGWGALGLGVCFLVFIADTLLAKEYGVIPFLPARDAGRAPYLREALVGGLIGGLVVLGVFQLTNLAVEMLTAPRASVGFDLGDAFDATWPAGRTWLLTAVESLVAVSMLGIAAALALTWLRTRARIVLVSGLLAAGMALEFNGTLLGFVAAFIINGIRVFAVSAWLVWFLRRNATGYLVAAGVVTMAPKIVELGQHPAYRFEALVLTMILVAIAGALILWWRREARREPDVAGVGGSPSAPA